MTAGVPPRRTSLLAAVALVGVAAYLAPASGQPDGEVIPLFVSKIPHGYRDWTLISVAREEGDLDDVRAILGNDIAIKAYREGKLPFPDGSIIARLAWSYLPSAWSWKATCKHGNASLGIMQLGQRVLGRRVRVLW